MEKFKLKLTLGTKLLDKKMKVIKSEGETLIKALSNLKAPEIIKTVGSLEVNTGERTLTRMLTVPRVRMLFNEKSYYREVLAKNIEIFLR